MSGRLRTGSLGLDLLLGGGWKPGTVNEVWGGPGSGKTVLARHAAWACADGCLWICLGTEVPVGLPGTLVAQPRNAELAFEAAREAAQMGIGLVVLDSADGLVRQRELDGDPGYVPHPQREFRDELTALKRACKTGTAVLFLSRPRDRERQPLRGTGISEKAAARVLLKLRHVHQDGSREVTARVAGLSRDVRETSLVLQPGTGVDWARELTSLGENFGLVRRRGAWLDALGQKFQGRQALVTHLHYFPGQAAVLERAIRAKAGI